MASMPAPPFACFFVAMWSILLVPRSARPILTAQAGGATPREGRAAVSQRVCYWLLVEPFEPLEPDVPPDVLPPVVPPAEPLVAAPPPLEVVE
jgi:hypothetical protein